MAAGVSLEMEGGPRHGTRVEIRPHQPLVVGRHSTCRIRLLGDGRVSRFHCLLEADPPRVRVRDLGSLNGTFVNGVRLAEGEPAAGGVSGAAREAELRHGDLLTVGGSAFRVVVRTGVVCAECRRELDPFEMAHAVRTGEACVCGNCCSKWTVEYRPEFAIAVTSCARCGAALTASVADGAEPVCVVCREQAGAAADDLRSLADRGQVARETAAALAAYRLGRELGRGKLSTVFHAVRRSDGGDVAVKILPVRGDGDDNSRERFRREIAVLSRLSHPHIVRLFDYGTAAGCDFFATEYCNGGDLESFVARQGGRLTGQLAAALVEPCCAAVDYAHRLGIVHRDLKPRNILLDERDGRLTPKVADFGFAKAFQESGRSGLTLTGAGAGTPYFMPREQVTDCKYVGPASDVWSLAATYYYLLTGATPLEFPPRRDPLEVILGDAPIPIRERRADVPERTAAAIDRALSVDVAQRPPTVAAFFQLVFDKPLPAEVVGR